MASKAYPRIGAECKSEFGRSGALRTFPLRRRSGTGRAAASAGLGTGISIKSRSVPPESDLVAGAIRRTTQHSDLVCWSEPSHLQKEKIDVTHKQDCPY